VPQIRCKYFLEFK